MVNFAFASFGFSAEAAKQVFPTEMFLQGSDLKPIKEKLDGIIGGLTKWNPQATGRKLTRSVKLKVEGKDYEEAIANTNNLFLRNRWGDGLPLVPPTDTRVNWILSGAGLPRDTVIGKVLPRGGIATVETLAISLAMAGGRPEYLPVLIAAMKAILDPRFRHQGMNSTTCSCFPVVIVNGPAARQIRLNSGYGCLGPDPLHPAGASIGRAIRLLLLIVGEGFPGSGSMAIFGGPARYTNAVFAEDEEDLPDDWPPLAVERGFKKGSNVVTVAPALGAVNISGGGTASTREDGLKNLYTIASVMRNPLSNYFLDNWRTGSPGTVLISRYGIRGFSAHGWSKQDVKKFLWENSVVSWAEVERTTSPKEIEQVCRRTDLKKNEPWPIGSKPEHILIVAAGGEQSGHTYWMQTAWSALQPVSAEIELPANWSNLLEEAGKDLGRG